MSLALATRLFGEHASETWLHRLERVDVRQVRVDGGAPDTRERASASRLGTGLREAGVRVVAFAPSPPPALHEQTSLHDQLTAWLTVQCGVAAALGAGAVVLDLGTLDAPWADEARRAERTAVRTGEPVSADVRAAWSETRETESVRLVEALARVLHMGLREGAPLAVRVGEHAGARLSPVECGWLLDDLEGLRVWADPIRLERLASAGFGDSAAHVLEPQAARVVGVEVSGRDADLRPGRHPEDMPLPWSTLCDVLPATAAWTLDLLPGTEDAVVLDALAWARDRLP